MLKAVIFDLDGTLLYTLEDLKDSANRALAQFGYPRKSVEEIRTYVGNGVSKLIARCLPNGESNENFNQCLDFFKKDYKENMYNKTRPYSGIVEMLDILESKGIKTAVVSNKFDSAVKELCQKYFPNNFSITLGESKNIRKKPAPDSVLAVMEQLGAEKSSVIYVGDSEVDIQTAQNAQIPCISVDWGYKDSDFLKEHNAQTIVSSVEELTNKILTIWSI